MPDARANRNAPLWVTGVLLLVGVVLIVVAVIYFAESASKLPSFFPGHLAGSSHHHTKHGIAAGIVGAWMSGGRRTP